MAQLAGGLLRGSPILPQDLYRAERDVLEDRLVREQVEALEHHTELRAHGGEFAALLGKGLALDEDLARIHGLQTVDGAAQRRFARARGADHHDDLALAHGKAHVLEHMQVTEMLVHMAKLDDGSHGTL